MSHFVVFVISDTDNMTEVERLLQPYHEYECTGINDEYVVWVDHHDEVLKSWETLTASGLEHMKEYKDVDDYAKKYYGYNKRNGRYGALTNPNPKWDWYVVGGRWSGFLPKPADGDYRKGEPGLMGSQADPEGCDQARKGSINWEDRLGPARESAAAEYDKITGIIAGRVVLPWSHFRERADKREITYDQARAEYNGQPVIQDIEKAHADDPFYMMGFEPEEFSQTRDDFIANKALDSITPWAIVTPEHGWVEKSEMGWWGLYDREGSKDWQGRFGEVWATIPDDKYITVVDCHI